MRRGLVVALGSAGRNIPGEVDRATPPSEVATITAHSSPKGCANNHILRMLPMLARPHRGLVGRFVEFHLPTPTLAPVGEMAAASPSKGDALKGVHVRVMHRGHTSLPSANGVHDKVPMRGVGHTVSYQPLQGTLALSSAHRYRDCRQNDPCGPLPVHPAATHHHFGQRGPGMNGHNPSTPRRRSERQDPRRPRPADGIEHNFETQPAEPHDGEGRGPDHPGQKVAWEGNFWSAGSNIVRIAGLFECSEGAMPRGGHARSGPAPDPNALRRDRAGDKDWLTLPVGGYAGVVPECPLPDVSGAELSLWDRLWEKPQAAMWSHLGLEYQVAAYVRAYLRSVAADEAPVGLIAPVLRMEAELGLSTVGMNALRWKFSADEVGEKRATPVKKGPTMKDRLKVVDGSG